MIYLLKEISTVRTSSLCKNVLNGVTFWPMLWITFLNFFFHSKYNFIIHNVYKNTQVKLEILLYVSVYLFIPHSLYWISCCSHAERSLSHYPHYITFEVAYYWNVLKFYLAFCTSRGVRHRCATIFGTYLTVVFLTLRETDKYGLFFVFIYR